MHPSVLYMRQTSDGRSLDKKGTERRVHRHTCTYVGEYIYSAHMYVCMCPNGWHASETDRDTLDMYVQYPQDLSFYLCKCGKSNPSQA